MKKGLVIGVSIACLALGWGALRSAMSLRLFYKDQK